jgi:acyl-CoA reductase-like NAD-dependent aldehyde dehydrogenase
MVRETLPYFVANEPRMPNANLAVIDKYTGEVATRVALADRAAIDEAINWSVKAVPALRKLPSYKRAEVLHYAVKRFSERFEELAVALCIEAGKPIRDARGEVTRLIDTFRIAAEEAVRFGGQYMPLDISARAKGYESIVKRVPIGPCSFISPFNFPLNLAAHKIAPALAVGCPFVLKPASLTPIGAIIIGEVLAECDLPKGTFSILPVGRDGADLFTTDERLKLLSFTGSPDVGWALKAKAGKKKVILELGGNAGCIVDKDADLAYAAERITFGAFYQSGQSCISVQRILIHESVYDELKLLLIDRATALKAGNPQDESTTLGPIISEKEAIRIETWINEAVSRGATLLCGGKRQGVFVDATLLENVDPKDKIYSEEVFGPAAVIERFSSFKDAVEKINDSKFGLQAGIFTKNIDHAFFAWNELDVGGVIIGDIPSMRVDNMPYGGVKESGLGREGIVYAMEDMTEIRLMVLNNIGRSL